MILFLLALLGGLLYALNNYDAMNYRLPKVVHWLMAERWEWIPANNNNLNTRSSGTEWMMAPLIAIFRTDRHLFLLNLIHFAFLPGLAFGFLKSVGVKARVAWS